jgi:guanosine-3',5'-bis(diphosphate) 3'-pyrophosphohydrolase
MHDPFLFLDAVSFAARAHQGHLRKDKVTPYAAHVFRVGLIVRHVFGLDDPRILTAAVLHDTIEDTTTDFDDLAERYGVEVAQWVAYLTKDKKQPETFREEAYLADLNRAPWQVKACKLADLLDNMLDSKHLPADKKAKSLARYRHYWSAFQKWPEPELQKPLAVVGDVVREVIG